MLNEFVFVDFLFGGTLIGIVFECRWLILGALLISRFLLLNCNQQFI